nr:hypothetical protein CFP56_36335 [Quercus suber]
MAINPPWFAVLTCATSSRSMAIATTLTLCHEMKCLTAPTVRFLESLVLFLLGDMTMKMHVSWSVTRWLPGGKQRTLEVDKDN